MSWLKKILHNWLTHSKESELQIFWNDILVGILKYEEGFFVFVYDKNCPEEFKIKSMNAPIFKSKSLPPFFATRIPSSERPDISAEILKYNDDPIEILGHLGARSAISPYVFKLKKAS